MKKSDGLFDLIHSLTPSEKRHFKLSSNLLKSENKKYLVLFEALEKQRVYDEKKLRNTMKGQPFMKELHVIKAYLFESILKSLRARRGSDIPVMSVYQFLEDNQILSRRGLHELGEKKLKKAGRLARKNDFQILSIQIYADELNHATGKAYSANNIAHIHSLFADVQQNLKVLKTDFILTELSYLLSTKQFTNKSNQKEVVDREMDRLLEQAKNEFDPEQSDLNAKKLFYKLVKDYCFLRGNKQEAYKYAKLCFDIVSADPEEPVLDSHYYLVTLCDYYVELLGLSFVPQPEFRNYETIKKFVEKIDQVPGTHRIIAFEKWMSSYRILLTWCIYMNDYKRGAVIVRQLYKEWPTYSKYLRKMETGYFYLYTARIFFGNEEYDASLEYVNKILNDPEMDIFLVSFTRLFSLIVHYELGNLRYLQHAIRTTSRYFRENKMFDKPERLVIQFIKALLKISNKKDRDKELRALLENLEKVCDNSVGRDSSRYYLLARWCEAKLTGIPFRDAVHAKEQGVAIKKSQ